MLSALATTSKEEEEEDEDITTTTTTATSNGKSGGATVFSSSFFRATSTADEATCLTDGVQLVVQQQQQQQQQAEQPVIILPWMGFGTYKLGRDNAEKAVLDAICNGYRSIDTAFIYGGEQTERAVGRAIQKALLEGIIQDRRELFLTTKHWRKYHGYDATLQCLKLSLKRLQVDYVDLYLIHWPGPAYQTMSRRKDVLAEQGPWYYTTPQAKTPTQQSQLRLETWRAMEDALAQGLVKSIGVSNYSVQHLQELKHHPQTKIWPPSVNQVEFHPLYPQHELLEYCRKEGIVLQAYASLGGQDTGKKQWDKLDLESGMVVEEEEEESIASSEQQQKKQPPKRKRKPKQKKLKDTVVSLLTCRPVVSIAQKHQATAAQVLLRWALSQNCVVIPKSATPDRQIENAMALTSNFCLTLEEINDITNQVQSCRSKAATNTHEKLNDDDIKAIETIGESALGRLCWRNDPFRHLDC